MLVSCESGNVGGRMVERDEPKLTRETGDGFDIFREPPDKNGKPGIAYIRQDCPINFVLDRYRLTASTLSEKDAGAARTQSSDMAKHLAFLNEFKIPEGDPANESIRYVNHADIFLSAPLNMKAGGSLGLITSQGAELYEHIIELYVHIGAEEHSHVVHYEGYPIERTEESVFFSAYISRERMEWLHHELISRPNAVIVMRASIDAFKAQAGSFLSLFGDAPWLLIEPKKATHLKDVSFDVYESELRAAERDQYPLSDALTHARDKWIQHNCRSPNAEDDEPWKQRCANVVAYTSPRIAKWSAKNGEAPNRMVARLNTAKAFLQDLDAAIHSNGPFSDAKNSLWQHINFKHFFSTTKTDQRDEFVSFYGFDESVDQYIASPFLQNDYLDWLMLDTMTAQKTVALFETFMMQKHGMAYAFFGAIHWKLLLWKLIMRPLAFLFGWVLPVVGFYFIAQWSLWLGIGLAVVYYGFSLLMLARWLWYKLSFIFTGAPTPLRRLMQQIEEMDQLYPLLTGPVMHVGTIRKAFERASEKGVIWDQRIFYLLDHLVQRNPQPWNNSLPRRIS
jgi:hypothetical protein